MMDAESLRTIVDFYKFLPEILFYHCSFENTFTLFDFNSYICFFLSIWRFGKNFIKRTTGARAHISTIYPLEPIFPLKEAKKTVTSVKSVKVLAHISLHFH